MSIFLKRMSRRLRGTFTVGTLLLALTGCSLAGSARGAPIDLNAPAVIPVAPADGERYPLAAPSAARGAAIYGEKCAACHGASGAGDGTIVRAGPNVAGRAGRTSGGGGYPTASPAGNLYPAIRACLRRAERDTQNLFE